MRTIYLIRHEKRFNDGLNECSLTPEGIKSALTKFDTLITDKDLPIYCSPMLRTIQTIYPYAKKNNKIINLDNTLYEYIGNNISHYSMKKKLPTIECLSSTNFYNDLHQYFMNNIINYKTESQLLEQLKIFIIFLQSYVFNDDITDILGIITKLIVQLDKQETSRKDIYDDIQTIYKILKKYKMSDNFRSLDKKIIIKKETYEDVIIRTQDLTKQMLKEDGIYITHLTTLNALLINLYKEIYKDKYCEMLKTQNDLDYCKNNVFPMGCIIKLQITDTIIMQEL